MNIQLITITKEQNLFNPSTEIYSLELTVYRGRYRGDTELKSKINYSKLGEKGLMTSRQRVSQKDKFYMDTGFADFHSP